MSTDINHTRDSGHEREWQDRARVILDMKKEMEEFGSPKQSPAALGNTKEEDEVEENSDNPGRRKSTEIPY